MEVKAGEQRAVVSVEATRNNSFSARFRSIRDRLAHRETSSLQWAEWKKIILENRAKGIPEAEAPESFLVGQSLMETFQEMLPVDNHGDFDYNKFPNAAAVAEHGFEVVRSFVVDASGSRLLVHAKNHGNSKRKYRVERQPPDREIGLLHTHPIDVMPSSIDVTPFLYGSGVIEYVVTPNRVIAFFRTDKTQKFTSPFTTKSYIEGMGRSKGKHIGQEGAWSVEYEDLKELRILAYEAVRGKNKFVRKDNKA
jgi:hypothetical protein